MQKVTTDHIKLFGEVVRAIVRADDVSNDENLKRYARFFLKSGYCTQQAHDDMIEMITEGPKLAAKYL